MGWQAHARPVRVRAGARVRRGRGAVPDGDAERARAVRGDRGLRRRRGGRRGGDPRALAAPDGAPDRAARRARASRSSSPARPGAAGRHRRRCACRSSRPSTGSSAERQILCDFRPETGLRLGPHFFTHGRGARASRSTRSRRSSTRARTSATSARPRASERPRHSGRGECPAQPAFSRPRERVRRPLRTNRHALGALSGPGPGRVRRGRVGRIVALSAHATRLERTTIDAAGRGCAEGGANATATPLRGACRARAAAFGPDRAPRTASRGTPSRAAGHRGSRSRPRYSRTRRRRSTSGRSATSRSASCIPLSPGMTTSVISKSIRPAYERGELEGGLAARRREHRVAVGLEHLAARASRTMSSSSTSSTVSVPPLRGTARGRLLALGDTLPHTRQVDLERRAAARLGVRPDMAAGLRDDPVDGREPEPGALAGRLRGEERVEHAVERLALHAHAGVADGEHRRSRPARAPTCWRANCSSSSTFAVVIVRLPAVRHRVARVDREVHQDLLDLARVGARVAEVVGEVRRQLDLLAEQPREHAVRCPSTTSFEARAPSAGAPACG